MLFWYWQRYRDEKRRQRTMTEIIMKPFTSRISIAITAFTIALMLAVLLIVSTANAEDVSDTVQMYVFVAEGSWLNVRETPKAHANVTLRMERGEVLTVYSLGVNGWAEVGRAGDSGYCRIEYLSDDLPGEPVQYTTMVGKLHVRTLPFEKAETVCKLQKGVNVAVLGMVTVDDVQWARVENGFIQSGFLAEVE